MQCLIALETENDPISACRLMNIFRRKGLKLVTLAMAPKPEGFSLLAEVEFAESELGHIFNFLRRTEGVRQVSCYRPDSSIEAAFALVSADSDRSSVEGVFKAFPGSKLIFASEGRYFLELPAASRPPSMFCELEFVPFARVMTSERAQRPEPVGTVTER